MHLASPLTEKNETHEVKVKRKPINAGGTHYVIFIVGKDLNLATSNDSPNRQFFPLYGMPIGWVGCPGLSKGL